MAGGPDIHERISCEIVQVGVGLQLESPTPGKITPYLRLNFLMGFPQHLRYEMTHKNDSIALPALRQMMDGTRISPGWKLGAGLCYQLLPQLSLQFGVNYITQKVRVGWPIVAYRNFQGVAMRLQSVGISLGAQVHW